MGKTLSLGAFEELLENEIMVTEGGLVRYCGSTHGGGGIGGSRDKKSEIATFFDIFISVDPYSPGGSHYNPYGDYPKFNPWMR